MVFNRKFSLGAVALAAMIAMPAEAAVFDFSITSANGNAMGQFTATDMTGYYLVTDVTGTVDGNAITDFTGVSYGGNDNEILIGSQLVTRNGLAFKVGSTFYSIFDKYSDPTVTPVYNFCVSTAEPYCTGDEATNAPSAQLSITLAGTGSAVPEPASWAMMVGGFGLVGAAMRRRSVAVRFA